MKVDWLGAGQDYEAVFGKQEELMQEQRRSGVFEPVLLLLEHSPVYTMGRMRDQSSLGNRSILPHPVVEINRGGQATYHGPGQLVGYPIVNLDFLGRDLHRFVDGIESCLIAACAEFGVIAGKKEGLIGIWTEERKLASIGVGVKHWITMHGFALNITNESLSPFMAITPCGIEGVIMTSLEAEMKRSGWQGMIPSSEEVGRVFARYFEEYLDEVRLLFESKKKTAGP